MSEIEQRKRIEEELLRARKLEAIGRLAGGIAHDFNNLMTIVIGYCESLRSATPPALQKQVDEIHKAAEQANSLTRQLLAFSRRHKLQPSVLEINNVLKDMSEMLRRLLSEDIELTILGDSTSSAIRANEGQIEQVIMNLVINAAHAMPRGGKLMLAATNVSVLEERDRIHLGAQPGPFVRLTVSDTGIGMDPELKARIFDPFFTTKGPGKGTGLGLTTVYGIVTQAGGHIAVESEPGKGTTFYVYFPRVENVGASESRPEQVFFHASTRGSETVLVVDDQEGLCTLLCEILRQNGYRVVPALNGVEALRFVHEYQGRIDLVITDIVMPQMGGRELAQALRVLQPQTRILCMSGYTDREDDINELLSGDHAFIDKPFTPQAILHKIRDVLSMPTHSLRDQRQTPRQESG